MNDMCQIIPLAALLLGIVSLCSAADADVYRYAVEVNVKRVEGALLKYTRFNSESPFPCLRLELVSPRDDWAIVERKDICEMNGLSLMKDFSYAGFSKVVLHDGAVSFEFNYILNDEPGEYAQSCTVEAKKRILSNVKCTDPQSVD